MKEIIVNLCLGMVVASGTLQPSWFQLSLTDGNSWGVNYDVAQAKPEATNPDCPGSGVSCPNPGSEDNPKR